MKSLEQLKDVEKGRLLHQLFPAEIPDFLQFVVGVSETIEEEQYLPSRRHDEWVVWLKVAPQIRKTIRMLSSQLQSSSWVFSEQLFNQELAPFLTYCLTLYTEPRKHSNEKFTKVV